MAKSNTDYFYKDHPKTCAPKDFWGQVKRTVNDKPVSDEQIDMIVHAVTTTLDLGANDTVLDLCCGNGALSTHFFSPCRQGLGVDFSDYLIQVAKENFEFPPKSEFILQDVMEYVHNEPVPERFTKAVIYGSFQYLPFRSAQRLLEGLRSRFTGIQTVFIGNLPDKEKIHIFYQDRKFDPTVVNDPFSPIGIWRSQSEVVNLAETAGWDVTFHTMPGAYYAASYRFDAVLTPTAS